MKYSTKTGQLATLSTPCLVSSFKTAQQISKKLNTEQFFDIATRNFTDTIGETLVVNLPKSSDIQQIVLAGGADDSVTERDYRKLTRSIAQVLRKLEPRSALWTLTTARVETQDIYWKTLSAIQLLSDVFYQFDVHKEPSKPLQTKSIQIHIDNRSRQKAQKAVRHGNALDAGLRMAKDLGNQPPNVCHPNYLLRETRKLSKLNNLKVTSLDEKRMEELGMGAFLAVSKGSVQPGKMIIAHYKGTKSNTAPIVLVGKGITFDTGGISLKPPPAMDEMKFDMCGAASVLGVTRAVAEANLPVNLITIVAAAENMPSGKATRPGDIVKSHSGKTVEILNTDAEGRLVLCDALSYAKRYKPKVIIDVATLTGAVIVALGSHASAVYSQDDQLADDLVNAGEWTGDRAWRMPLWEEYQIGLKSNFADMANIAGPGAGSITAASFLSKFVGTMNWAHMDVAGSAFKGGAQKGSTGRPVSLLFRYIVSQASS